MRRELTEQHEQHANLSSEDMKVGHLGDGGVQRWSAGPLFPYHVVVVEHYHNDKHGLQTVFALNGEDGRITTPHVCSQDDRAARLDAYGKAEQDARRALDRDAHRHLRSVRILEASQAIERIIFCSGR